MIELNDVIYELASPVHCCLQAINRSMHQQLPSPRSRLPVHLA
jgi:hypothetical protein